MGGMWGEGQPVATRDLGVDEGRDTATRTHRELGTGHPRGFL